jgi:hypothetical protein
MAKLDGDVEQWGWLGSWALLRFASPATKPKSSRPASMIFRSDNSLNSAGEVEINSQLKNPFLLMII